MSQSPLRSGLRALADALPVAIAAPLRSGVRSHRQSSGSGAREDAELDLIRAHIDVGYYRQTYSATASLDPAQHYHESGWRDGHNPTAWFDTNAYLAANPDVHEAEIDPFLHYLQFGKVEQRALRPKENAGATNLQVSPMDNALIVSDYWAKERDKTKPVNWLDHPVTRDFLTRRATGNPNTGTAEWFRRKYLPQPAELALSLGCGFGEFDRYAIRSGIARKLHANDISAGAIEKARAAAEKEGLSERIEYSIVDLNKVNLPTQAYDAILAVSCIHHVFQLEDLFKQIRKALKPGAMFFLDEYIGPSRFQTSPFVTDVINRLLAILPERYRKNLFQNDGSVISRYSPNSIDWFEKNDPSESVRSGELMNTLRMYFDVVDYLPYGGGVLQMLLSGIVGNFDVASEADRCMLNLLSVFEEILEQSGAVQSDFAAIICRAK